MRARTPNISRPDCLCYDNPNGQVCPFEAWSGTEHLKIPNISRLDDLCYDNPNEQV